MQMPFPRVLVLTVASLVVLSGCQGGVIAVVNGHRIHRDDLWEELNRQGVAEQLVQTMIDTWLLEQDAQAKGIVVTDEEVDAVVKFYDEKGLLPSLRAGLTDEGLREFIRRRLVMAQLVVAEDELEAIYEQYRQDFNDPRRARLRRIVTSDRDELAALRERILAGEVAFEEAARTSSVDLTTRSQGGEWGWREETAPPPNVGDIVFAMQVGEITEPLPAVFPEGAWQIVQVTDVQEAVERPYAAVRPVVLFGMLYPQPSPAVVQELNGYLDPLRAQATVRIRDPQLRSLQQFYDERKAQVAGAPSLPTSVPVETVPLEVPEELEGYVQPPTGDRDGTK